MLRLHKLVKKLSFPTPFHLSKTDFVANVNEMSSSFFKLKAAFVRSYVQSTSVAYFLN